MSLTNPHTIRGRPTLKDVERFRNGSFHEFCRLKALITLKEVNTSDVETRKNVHEQNFDDEVKNNKQIVLNLPLVFNSLIFKIVTNNLIFRTSLILLYRRWYMSRKQIWGRFSNLWNSHEIQWNCLIWLTWSRILMYLRNTVGKWHEKEFKFIFGDRNLRLRDSTSVCCPPQQMMTEMT